MSEFEQLAAATFSKEVGNPPLRAKFVILNILAWLWTTVEKRIDN